ncbi:MAG: dual specificity protein phosphatase family protein [bacterium]|nr:dual specificity protein phosphatase family protein [bacterium]
MKPRKRVVTVFVLVALAVLVFELRHFLFAGNLHSVIDGAVYRSAQPTPERLRAWTQALGLRSLINLKGGDPNEREDDATARAAVSAGLDVRYVRLSARRWPSPAEVERLITSLDDAPRPILLHCQGGTDRSGLAAAIALLLEGRSLDEASKQFALAYGYPGRALGSDLPGFLTSYRGWLAQRGGAHSPEQFRRWVTQDYVAYYYEAELAFEPLPAHALAGEPFSLTVRITNKSPEPIPMSCTEGAGVRLSLRLRQLEAGGRNLAERRFCDEAEPLAPGGQVRVIAGDYRLHPSGRYEFAADLVDEHREHWFEDMGSTVERLTLTVR